MAVFLALFGRQSKQNGLVFPAGWVAGLAGIVALILYVVDLSRSAL